MNSLADFIRTHLDEILEDWEAFARSAGPAGMAVGDLRNDAQRMLTFIASDMGTAQSPAQQRLKSEGRAPVAQGESAAHDHGTQRFAHGFDMNGMVSEYRALRATVIRLWAANNSMPMEEAMVQLLRFNEGVDQAITESVARFTGELDKSRDLFLAALGHDLRTPINVVVITAESLMRDPSATPSIKERAARIIRSSQLMGSIANDLLDFTRTRMGGKLPLYRVRVDIGEIASTVIQQLQPAYPERSIRCTIEGDAIVTADAARMSQVVTNLVLNALQHGDPGAHVAVDVVGTVDEATVRVHNSGNAIPEAQLDQLFHPWAQGAKSSVTANTGLGLYIVRQIVEAHDGSVEVASSPGAGTTFTVHLPRHP